MALLNNGRLGEAPRTTPATTVACLPLRRPSSGRKKNPTSASSTCMGACTTLCSGVRGARVPRGDAVRNDECCCGRARADKTRVWDFSFARALNIRLNALASAEQRPEISPAQSERVSVSLLAARGQRDLVWTLCQQAEERSSRRFRSANRRSILATFWTRPSSEPVGRMRE
jgi:hypothetical protein